MISLNNGDAIRAVASVTNVVTYSVSGYEGTNVINADGLVTDSEADIYLASADNTAITDVVFRNTDSSARTITLYRKKSGGTARALISYSLGVGYSLFTDGRKSSVYDESGNLKTGTSPIAHKDTHDPNDGGDPLDTANAAEISVVVAAGTGTSHSLARADHVHAIAHAITDNHLLTVDGTLEDNDFAYATASGIEGKTAAEAIALLLAATLPENTSVDFEDVLTADGKYTGFTMTGVAGATLAFGDLVYLQTADKRWELASSDNAAAGYNLRLGICVLAAANDGSATKVLLYGTVRADTAFPDLTPGAPVYMGLVAGDVQVAAPTGTTDIVRIVGHGGYTKEELIFAPSADWIKLV